MTNRYSLEGKVVLITGANGQLGSTFAERFRAEGAVVHATDLPELDVTDERSIRAAVEKIGSIDVLVNNAGIAVFTPFEERTAEEIDRVMAVNIKGTILCSKVCAEFMAKNGGGSIVNIASIYGVVPADKKIYGDSGRNSSEIYGATKAGIIQLTKYLAAYLAEKKIRVNAVSPGGVFNNQKEFFVKNYVAKTPLGRMAEPDDIASAVLFLASPEAAYVTGQNLTVDGGFTLNQ